MKVNELLATLKGTGNVRKATPEFWELRNQYPKTMRKLGVVLTKGDDGEWTVKLPDTVTQEAAGEAMAQTKANEAFYRTHVWQDVDNHLS